MQDLQALDLVVKAQVNISSAWFLPEEGFPVFYRYFDDKVTWDEAQAVCGSHHADLLSVQTTGEMDAARAYLKEIDVADNIWIGLQKNSPEEAFSWANGERLLGEGYWLEPVPKSSEKLCAAIDPTADFRWKSFYCRGPQLGSFVCQLAVPDWAKKDCLIKSLPSLTVTLLPEAGVIQLLSDCGLDGTRRIACNEKADREEIIKRLSCDVDAFASTVFGRSTTADAVRDTNTQVSWSDISNRINRHETTKSYRPLTRHRRSAAPSTVNLPPRHQTTPPTDKLPSPTFPNLPSHVFPHSPYLASERNAPSTRKPLPPHPAGTPPTPNDTTTLYKPLPVLIITGENLNDSASSGTSENPPIVLMIENKDLDGPFLFPVADDIIINNPSLSPGEIISVDLVEVDNFTANTTAVQTTPSELPGPPPLKTHSGEAAEELQNIVEGDAKEEDFPQRPNRGRLFPHTSQSSFYPRFLNRVLG